MLRIVLAQKIHNKVDCIARPGFLYLLHRVTTAHNHRMPSTPKPTATGVVLAYGFRLSADLLQASKQLGDLRNLRLGGAVGLRPRLGALPFVHYIDMGLAARAKGEDGVGWGRLLPAIGKRLGY